SAAGNHRHPVVHVPEPPAHPAARRRPDRGEPASQPRRVALREARALGDPAAPRAAGHPERAQPPAAADHRRLGRADPRHDVLTMFETRVLSGMRPTGRMHLGHYHGVLKNWVRLQAEYPCLYFVADWHALTTDYEKPEHVKENGWDMVIDWLAAGIDPSQAVLFIQSQVPEHAELQLLLSMMSPLG